MGFGQPEITLSKNLDELLENLRRADEAGALITSLPAFGGTRPRDTPDTWIWSWDAARLLVGCWGNLEIRGRESN